MALTSHNSLPGYQGRISIPNEAVSFFGGTAAEILLHVTDLEWEDRPEVADNSTFDDASNAKRKIQLMYDGAGRCSGYLDRTIPLPKVTAMRDETLDGTVVGFKIWPKNLGTTAGAPAKTFTGIISNFRWSVAKTGRAAFSCSFESSGDTAESTASYP